MIRDSTRDSISRNSFSTLNFAADILDQAVLNIRASPADISVQLDELTHASKLQPTSGFCSLGTIEKRFLLCKSIKQPQPQEPFSIC